MTLPLELAQHVCGRAWRVQGHSGGHSDTRTAIVLLTSRTPAEDNACGPIGWVALRWRPSIGPTALVHRVGWDARSGATESDIWRALEALMGEPLAEVATPPGAWRGANAA